MNILFNKFVVVGFMVSEIPRVSVFGQYRNKRIGIMIGAHH